MNSWLTWPVRMIGFLLWYAKEFLLANLQVTADILRPSARMRTDPAIVAVPAASRTASEYTLISSLITLTPGTLTITYSRDHAVLYVHGMFAASRDGLAEEIQEMEDRLLRAMRREPGDLSRPLARPTVRPAEDAAAGAGDASAGTAESENTENDAGRPAGGDA
ncbi:hypothetical protein GCM10027060_19280 [Nesterenkonia halophila]|uniref:Na+/H+ antiporter subunit E n=1 Tax=Nesterenkonia halophila TaxID=302044 RepID=UPI001291A4F2|nr:Na+/H+ antiporter subunit E [Nesterenkonia halophila]